MPTIGVDDGLKYGAYAYDSRPAKEALLEFTRLLVDECALYQGDGGESVFTGGVIYKYKDKFILGERFLFIPPYYSEEYERKPYLDFLYEMKWLVRERHLLEEPYENPDDELRNGEKFYYLYGINHEQLEANFCDRLASEREYDERKLDKLVSVFWD